MSKRGYVYILASKPNGTLYVGVTSDPVRRIQQHKEGEGASFTAQYGVTRLVYIEEYEAIDEALRREKQLKGWRREWKLALIRVDNPTWEDRYEEVCQLLAGRSSAVREHGRARLLGPPRHLERGRGLRSGRMPNAFGRRFRIYRAVERGRAAPTRAEPGANHSRPCLDRRPDGSQIGVWDDAEVEARERGLPDRFPPKRHSGRREPATRDPESIERLMEAGGADPG